MHSFVPPLTSSTRIGPSHDIAIWQRVAEFSDAINGRLPLDGGAGNIAQVLGADKAVICRSAGRQGALRVVASHDGRSPKVNDDLRRCYTAELLGPYLDRFRAGTVWSLSRHRASEGDDLHPSVSALLGHGGVRDIIIIVLTTTAGYSDYLELYFTSTPGRDTDDLADMLGPILARFWATRKPGLVAETLAHRRVQLRGKDTLKAMSPLLSDANPAQLTRAEFRVCLLVSRGLSPKAIAEELSVSVTTVRTHLRNIYEKTEVSGFHELAHRLITVDAAPRSGMSGPSVA